VTIKSPQDFWAGAMFMAFGLFALIWSLYKYKVGTAVAMGPGYFPTALGGLLALIGGALVVGSMRVKGEHVPAFGWRPLILVSAAVVAYGYLLDPLGLVLSTIILVMASAVAGHEFRWKESLLLGAALIVFSVAVFVKGLSLRFPICPKPVDPMCQRLLTPDVPAAPPAAKRRSKG
jgi:Tripartite tricarboxylate transporter TctB family